MGGHAAGEVASAIALQTVAAGLGSGRHHGIGHRRGPGRQRGRVPPLAGGSRPPVAWAPRSRWSSPRPGTTDGTTSWWPTSVTAGPTCCTDGELRQLTRDHSYVEEMLAAGQITADEARRHPHRHVVTRALGVESAVAVDTWLVTPEPGDHYLLCSDGLVNEVADEDIARIITGAADPQAAAEALVSAANEAGGRDNISVVVVEVMSAARADAAGHGLRAESAAGSLMTSPRASTTTAPIATAATGVRSRASGASGAAQAEAPAGHRPDDPVRRAHRRRLRGGARGDSRVRAQRVLRRLPGRHGGRVPGTPGRRALVPAHRRVRQHAAAQRPHRGLPDPNRPQPHVLLDCRGRPLPRAARRRRPRSRCDHDDDGRADNDRPQRTHHRPQRRPPCRDRADPTLDRAGADRPRRHHHGRGLRARRLGPDVDAAGQPGPVPPDHPRPAGGGTPGHPHVRPRRRWDAAAPRRPAERAGLRDDRPGRHRPGRTAGHLDLRGDRRPTSPPCSSSAACPISPATSGRSRSSASCS